MRDCLLVDAYNLFHAARASSHARHFPDIKRLAFFLEHYTSESGSVVTLVIDGTRLADEFVETATLRVLFSQAGQTADAVMEAWMARLPAAERLSWVLVSNDLHLCRMGAGMGLRVRPCASVIEDLARFANPASRRTRPTDSQTASSRKPFNNPFGRLASAAVLMAITAFSAQPCRAMEFSGFSKPDSVACDSETGEVFVSNSEPAAADTQTESGGQQTDRRGFVSKISANGLVLVQRFIQRESGGSGGDLKDPRGMAVVRGRLYAADGEYLRMYRTDTGAWLESIRVAADPPAELSSVALGRKGEIYVADADEGRIFKISTRKGNAVELLVQDEVLRETRGLAFDAGTHQLLAVTRASGRLFRVDTRGRIQVVRKGLGKLSGVLIDSGGNVYLSSEERGEVYRISKRGEGILALAAGEQVGATGIGHNPVTRSIWIVIKAEGRVVSVPAPEDFSGVSAKNART